MLSECELGNGHVMFCQVTSRFPELGRHIRRAGCFGVCQVAFFFYLNRKVLRYFRKDDHNWMKKKNVNLFFSRSTECDSDYTSVGLFRCSPSVDKRCCQLFA